MLNTLRPLFAHISRLYTYRYPLIGALIIALFAFTVLRINSYLDGSRDEAAFIEAKASVESFTFNQEAINTILELRDAGVDIEPSFPSGRTNPF